MKLAAILLGCSLVLGAHRAEACLCFAQPDLASAREQADAVFHGRVVSVKEPPRLLLMLGLAVQGEVVLEVREVFKGSVGASVLVLTPGEPTDCDVEFVVGRDYVVFGKRRGPGFVVGSRCSATTAISDADRELRWLRVGGPAKPPAAPAR